MAYWRSVRFNGLSHALVGFFDFSSGFGSKRVETQIKPANPTKTVGKAIEPSRKANKSHWIGPPPPSPPRECIPRPNALASAGSFGEGFGGDLIQWL